jgi:hypothetical protein
LPVWLYFDHIPLIESPLDVSSKKATTQQDYNISSGLFNKKEADFACESVSMITSDLSGRSLPVLCEDQLLKTSRHSATGCAVAADFALPLFALTLLFMFSICIANFSG